MGKVYTCGCGMRTTEPFYIGGVMMCTLCAEEASPHIVTSRAAMNWREFQRAGRKVPTSPYRRRWETTREDDDSR